MLPARRGLKQVSPFSASRTSHRGRTEEGKREATQRVKLERERWFQTTEHLKPLRVEAASPRTTSREPRVRVVERVVATLLLRPPTEPGPRRVPALRLLARAEEPRHPVEQVARLRSKSVGGFSSSKTTQRGRTEEEEGSNKRRAKLKSVGGAHHCLS